MHLRAAVTAACLLALTPCAALAADGDPDPSFGSGSVATTTLTNTPFPSLAMTRLGDGKILTAYVDTGGLRLTRYDASGVLDPGFGVGGVVTTPALGNVVLGLATQSDGKLLVLTREPIAVARYSAAGAPDPSFGVAGLATAPACGTEGPLLSFAVQGDDKAVLAYSGQEPPSHTHSCVVRFDAGGGLDPAFGIGGVVALANSAVATVALQGDAILLGGAVDDVSQVTVTRLKPDGAIDGGFGSHGVFQQALPPTGYAVALAVQPDGRVVVLANGGFDGGLVLRLDPNGELDPSFGVAGVTSFPVPAGYDSVSGVSVALQRDGRIIVLFGAEIFNPPFASTGSVVLGRFDLDGTLDASFSSDGFTFGTGDAPRRVVMQPDGKALVASATDATTFDPTTSSVQVQRFFGLTLPCAPSAVPGCHASLAPSAGKLRMDDPAASPKAAFQWKWGKGAATALADFGDPIGGDDYTVCLYDESSGSTLTSGAVIPGGGLCKGKPCWKALGTSGFAYTDARGTRFGISSLKLKAGVAGKAQLALKGRGPNLPVPGLPAALPLRIQLIAENGQCWESVFSTTGTTRNDGARYQGKSD